MSPVFHLSIPVRHLQEAVAFYTSQLGAQIGRRTATYADALLFGAQVTLQDDPSGVPRPMPRTRHFGATLAWSEWESAAERLSAAPFLVEEPTISFAGQSTEQAKLMVADPSGNLIEIKAYRHPEAVLGPLGTRVQRQLTAEGPAKGG
jgi:extradiol dioxygenase family protein